MPPESSHPPPAALSAHKGVTRTRMEPIPDVPEGLQGDLARRLREARVERGHSQAWVAAAMEQRGHGWHQTTVAKTERAEREPRYTELVALAQIFRVPMATFFAGPRTDAELTRAAERRGLEQRERLLRLELEVAAEDKDRAIQRVQDLERRLREVRRQAKRLAHD